MCVWGGGGSAVWMHGSAAHVQPSLSHAHRDMKLCARPWCRPSSTSTSTPLWALAWASQVDMLRRAVHALGANRVLAFMNFQQRLQDTQYKLQARGIKVRGGGVHSGKDGLRKIGGERRQVRPRTQVRWEGEEGVIKGGERHCVTLYHCPSAATAKAPSEPLTPSSLPYPLKPPPFPLLPLPSQAGALHGELPRLTRSNLLNSFRRGKLRVLCVSDVAARGLDVPACDAVFNLELPSSAAHYAHRAGRTGKHL